MLGKYGETVHLYLPQILCLRSAENIVVWSVEKVITYGSGASSLIEMSLLEKCCNRNFMMMLLANP